LVTREKQHLLSESFSAFHIYKSDRLQPLCTSSQKIKNYYLLTGSAVLVQLGIGLQIKEFPANENRQSIDNTGLT
jgi:hypothetical protein